MKTEQGNAPEAIETPPWLTMRQLISGFWVSRAIYVAAKLEIADLVKDQPKTAVELARATQHARPVSDSKLNATESPKLFATEKKSRDIIVLLLE